MGDWCWNVQCPSLESDYASRCGLQPFTYSEPFTYSRKSSYSTVPVSIEPCLCLGVSLVGKVFPDYMCHIPLYDRIKLIFIPLSFAVITWFYGVWFVWWFICFPPSLSNTADWESEDKRVQISCISVTGRYVSPSKLTNLLSTSFVILRNSVCYVCLWRSVRCWEAVYKELKF